MLVKARGETSCRIRFLSDNSALLSPNLPTFIFWCFSGEQKRSKYNNLWNLSTHVKTVQT